MPKITPKARICAKSITRFTLGRYDQSEFRPMNNKIDRVIDLDHRIASALTPEGFREMVEAMADRAITVGFMIQNNIMSGDRGHISIGVDVMINEIADIRVVCYALCDSIQSEKQSEDERP